MSYNQIKYLYETGCYSAEDVAAYVQMGMLTNDEFHSITGYSYEGIKKG